MTKEITSKRQDNILTLLDSGEPLHISQIISGAAVKHGPVSKITINRDLDKLIRLNYIVRQGKGRAAAYCLSSHYNLVKSIDVLDYFQAEADQRKIKGRFNFDIFASLGDIFNSDEKSWLLDLNKEYQANIKKLPSALYQKELERLIIEFSWKSSQIEGNTYTLLETEALILERKRASGHKEEEATMILNHKKALDFILKNRGSFKNISLKKIEEIHSLVAGGLGISKNIRKAPVGITGTKYKPIDNQWQIKEALEKTCVLVNKEKDIFTKSIMASIMIAYIQPFEDGNKRTSRLLGNAILLAASACPLSYRNASEEEYKKAVLLFFEQNNISYYKQLFLKQYEFAVKNYFRA